MKTGQDCRFWREAIRVWVGEGATGEQVSRIQSHVAGCGECRRYAEELQAAAGGLRWLAGQQVEPGLGFRARWMRAVEEAAAPRGFAETAVAVAAWWRGWLLQNLRPALGVASLWILALLFRLSAPAIEPATQTTAARSPVEIYRALKTEQQLLAKDVGRTTRGPVAPGNRLPARPRSEGLPTEPTTQRAPTPTATANA